jgi:hypothetical protein
VALEHYIFKMFPVPDEIGGSLDDMSMSVSSFFRQRRAAREKTVAAIKEKWLSTKPKFCVLHWDSKLITLISGRK